MGGGTHPHIAHVFYLKMFNVGQYFQHVFTWQHDLTYSHALDSVLNYKL